MGAGRHLGNSSLARRVALRVALDGATATAKEQWDMGARIRDVAQAADGAIWLLQDDGKLVRLAKR